MELKPKYVRFFQDSERDESDFFQIPPRPHATIPVLLIVPLRLKLIDPGKINHVAPVPKKYCILVPFLV